jgi:hypothetical protein
MKALLYGIAALPFVATLASAEPLQLTSNQMDKVTAGFVFRELTPSNTSLTELSVYAGPLSPCDSCYLRIETSSISVQSQMGPAPFFVAP